jgi:hypothetical protein
MATADSKTEHKGRVEAQGELEAAHRFLDGFSVRRELGGPPLSIEERLRLLLGEEQPAGTPAWVRKGATIEERLEALEWDHARLWHYVVDAQAVGRNRLEAWETTIMGLQRWQRMPPLLPPGDPSPWLPGPPPWALRLPFSR